MRCYYGDWIVVYKGREIARWDHHLNVLVVRRYTRPDRIYQCYMNGFFKAFRVPVRVRYHSGRHLDTSAYVEDLDGFFDRIEAKNKVELRKAIKKRLSL